MTRRAWLLGLLVFAAGCSSMGPLVLQAQTLPVTKTLAWDAPASGCAAPEVCTYAVTLDGTTVATGLSALSQAVTFTTAGNHTLGVAATNQWGTGPAGTLSVVVVLPGSPRNPRIQ